MKKLLMAMALLPMIASSEVQFDYEENGDGTIIVVGPIGNPSGELAIPAQIDGRQVVAIGKKAFKKCINITEVVLTIPALVGYTAKKLPSGLKYNKKTGCIEGAAKKAGSYPFSLTVTTKAGSKVSQDFTLTVREAEATLTRKK